MKKNTDDKAPITGNWTSWYIFVIVFLLVLVVLFYLFTKRFA